MVWLSYHKHLFFVLQSKFKVETFGFFQFLFGFCFLFPFSTLDVRLYASRVEERKFPLEIRRILV